MPSIEDYIDKKNILITYTKKLSWQSKRQITIMVVLMRKYTKRFIWMYIRS
ncbi:hypothetical protein BW42_03108 [Exiguobacterium sp. RIT341]|nr:hypothetical protein BW42_03108 [Exiguobacterium sp. RIT341]